MFNSKLKKRVDNIEKHLKSEYYSTRPTIGMIHELRSEIELIKAYLGVRKETSYTKAKMVKYKKR